MKDSTQGMAQFPVWLHAAGEAEELRVEMEQKTDVFGGEVVRRAHLEPVTVVLIEAVAAL